MADHLRFELVVDALQIALWNRRPDPEAVHHSDHGTQRTSWAFGHRLREAGLLGSMGSIGDCFDNSPADVTPRWVSSAPPTTKPSIPLGAPPRPQHDHNHPTLTVPDPGRANPVMDGGGRAYVGRARRTLPIGWLWLCGVSAAGNGSKMSRLAERCEDCPAESASVWADSCLADFGRSLKTGGGGQRLRLPEACSLREYREDFDDMRTSPLLTATTAWVPLRRFQRMENQQR
jgi:hypothetical protein